MGGNLGFENPGITTRSTIKNPITKTPKNKK
jgi:hypothetical protein